MVLGWRNCDGRCDRSSGTAWSTRRPETCHLQWKHFRTDRRNRTTPDGFEHAGSGEKSSEWGTRPGDTRSYPPAVTSDSHMQSSISANSCGLPQGLVRSIVGGNIVGTRAHGCWRRIKCTPDRNRIEPNSIRWLVQLFRSNWEEAQSLNP